MQKSDLFVVARRRKPVEQRERWIEKDGSPSIELCLRRQPARGRGGGHAGRIRRARFPVAHSEAQSNPRTVAGTADTSRLLEEVASAANLAQALLKVIRNQGAPGVDGQTVEEAQQNAAPLLA
jgi:hypothetical protein